MNHQTCTWIAMMIFLMLGSSHIALAKETIKAIVVREFSPEVKARVYLKYANVIKWPSENELKTFHAGPDETEYSRSCCINWMKLVLQEKWIPRDIKSKLAGLKKHPQEQDVLLANYSVGEHQFRIKDTSTELIIHITSPEFEGQVTDWGEFGIRIIRAFLRQPEKVQNFKKARIY